MTDDANQNQDQSTDQSKSNGDQSGQEAWQWNEDTPGTGNAPEWWQKDKYKTIADQAKSYNELQKKFGQFAGAPKDGYDLEKYKDTLQADHPVLTKLMEHGKAINMSQSGLEGIVDAFIEYEKTTTPNAEEFVNSLSDSEKLVASNISGWAKNNFSQEENDLISSWVTDKASLATLAKIRGLSKESRIPTNTNGSSVPSEKDVRSMIIDNYDKYTKEEHYRNKLDGQLAEAMANEGKM